METEVKSLIVNGVEYVRADSVKSQEMAEKVDGMEYCIIRTYSAGVFAGYVKSRIGQEAVLIKSRRIWSWYGASELSQLSQEGIGNLKDSRIAIEMPTVTVLQVIEILPCTEKVRKQIQEAPVWIK